MRPLLPLVLALALLGGCAGRDPEPAGQPAAESRPAGHPALNKLDATRKNMAEVEKKRAEDAKAAQDEAAGQNP